MKGGFLLPLRLAATACVLIFLLVLRGQVRSARDVLANIIMFAPYLLIISAWQLRPGSIIGFSAISGLVGAFLVRLVIGLSHHGMPSQASASPDYFSYLAYANLALLFAALGTWAWKHSEVESRSIGRGAALGVASWLLLIGVLVTFF